MKKSFCILPDAKTFVVYSKIEVQRYSFFTLLNRKVYKLMSTSADSESAIFPSESPAAASIAPQEDGGRGEGVGTLYRS